MSQDHFDHIAHDYDSVFKPHVTAHYLEKRISFVKKISAGPNLLDYGCGTGILAAKLRDAGYRVFGTDYSAGMLQKAQERGIETKVCRDGIIPFDSDSFDLVISVAVFHHLETQENVSKALREMVRVAKPGGRIMIWDHNPLNPYWKFLMPRLPQDHGDERLVPLKEILSGLRESGASETKFWRKGWVPEFVPAWPMPAVKLVERLLEAVPLVRSFSAHNVIVGTKN